jgi:DNA-binding SARP family transcriptional activator
MPRWRISILGAETVHSTSGREIKVPPNVWALLAFLLASPYRTASRAQIAAALWPELDDNGARHCLASALWRTKEAFKPDKAPIIVEDERVRLELKSKVWVDAVAFDRRVRTVVEKARQDHDNFNSPAVHRAVDSYRGDFAPTIDADWVLIERERLRALHLDALFLLASSYGRACNWPATITLARRLCAAEPLREDAQRLLMVALAKTGNRGLALKQYEHCRAVLEKELNVQPMPETSELYRQLALTADPEAAAPAEPPKMRSALLAAKQRVTDVLQILDDALEA